MAEMNQTSITPPRWTRHRGPRTLGVVMIVKDEAENLPALLETIREVADEVVVVDTGSTDGTQALCKRWGVTLLSDPWRDDFSRARNRAIQAATARYLLWLDGDDRLPEETRRELARLRDEVLPAAEPSAYELEVQNTDAAGRVRDAFFQPRLFPRRPDVRFRHAIHEELVTSLDQAGIPRRATGMAVLHTGYADAETVKRKQQRNERLLLRSLRTEGESVHHLVHLAFAVAGAGRAEEAEPLLARALELEEAGAARRELLAELYTLRATFMVTRGDRLAAAYDLERATELYPGWAVPPFHLAELRAAERDWDAARDAIRLARAGTLHTGLLGFGGRAAQSNLERLDAYICRHLGRHDEVRRLLGRALDIDPFNLDARLELGQALLDAEDFPAARDVLEPAGEDEQAVDRFVEVAAAIGLARAATGDLPGAGACLAPLLDVFASELGGRPDATPLDLSEAMLRAGQMSAARNMLALHQRTLRAA